MRTIGRLVISAALAVLLLLSGAAWFVRTPAGPSEEGALPAMPSTASLVGPATGGSLEATIRALQERLRMLPYDWRSYASLGLAYVAEAAVTGDPSWYPKAEGVLAASLRLRPVDNEPAEVGLGVLALARHDFEEALAHGRRAAELDPYGAEAYGVIGDALVELGRYPEAFEAFQTMVDARPDLASYARVAYARELLGDVPGAVRAMETAFEAAGTPADAAWAAFQLGELAFGASDVTGAEAWYERGMDLAPAFAPNLAGLGKVAWSRGDVGLAIRRYRDVVARAPAAEHVAALADLYASTGRAGLAAGQAEVVRAMHRLAARSGVNVDLELALFDADHGRPLRALEAARAEWGRRRSVHVADAMAWALYANGRYERAATFAERALALGTRNALFLFHAGMIRVRLGDEAGAERLLRRALATNPHFSILHAPSAAAALGELEGPR